MINVQANITIFNPATDIVQMSYGLNTFLTQFLLLLFKWQLHPLLMALQCLGGGMAVTPVYSHVLGTLGLSTSLWEIRMNHLTYQNHQPGSSWVASSATWGVQSLSGVFIWMEYQLQKMNAQLQVGSRYGQNTVSSACSTKRLPALAACMPFKATDLDWEDWLTDVFLHVQSCQQHTIRVARWKFFLIGLRYLTDAPCSVIQHPLELELKS